MIKNLILATSNEGKIKELKALLHPIPVSPQSEFNIEDADETGLSFIENAIIKARHAAKFTNQPALADDSGLVVPALSGEPGIYSARYARLKNAQNFDNIDVLINAMQGLALRDAYFYCAIVIVRHEKDPTPIIATGQISGQILESRQGSGGFGYDPIFYLPEYGCTMAEISPTLKNTISHRAQALIKIRQELSHEPS